MGELRFDSADGPNVTLYGWLSGMGQFRVPTLLGRTFDGTELTLIDSVVLGRETTLGPGTTRVRIRLRGRILLKGGHREEGAALLVQRARVRLAGLRELCLRTVYVDGTEETFLSNLPTAQRHTTLGSGSLTFECTETRGGSTFRESWERDTAVLIEADEPVTLREFEDRWLMPLQGLVLFAARAPTSQQELTLLLEDPDADNCHPAITRGTPDSFWREEPVEVLTAAPGLDAEPPPDYERLLVPFAALGAGASDFIAQWFRLYAELGHATIFLMSALGSRLFLENKLLNEMSFAESYHRIKHDQPPISSADHERYLSRMLSAVDDDEHREHYARRFEHAADQSARQRLKWLVSRAREMLPAVSALNSTLVGDLIETRNALTHLDPATPPPLSGGDLYYGVARLELVLQANLLADLGLPEPLVTSLVMSSYHNRVPVVPPPDD